MIRETLISVFYAVKAEVSKAFLSQFLSLLKRPIDPADHVAVSSLQTLKGKQHPIEWVELVSLFL